VADKPSEQGESLGWECPKQTRTVHIHI
jgi:hypothetical protein